MMKAISISGLPGSGTSTLARRLSEILKIPLVNSGDIFRKLAREHEMTLLEFGEYVLSHPEIDKKIDSRQVELARAGDIIIEGRLAGWNLYLNNVPSVKFLIEAPLEIRAGRVTWREEMSKEEIIEAFRKREETDAERYKAIYDIDLFCREPYDSVIDNGSQTEEETLKAIIMGLNEHIPELLDRGVVRA